MTLREGSSMKIVAAVLTLAFCLVPALMVETTEVTKPPTGDRCEMHCWAQWHQCLGHCNRPGALQNCESTCWTAFDICLWCCDEGPPESLQKLKDIFINRSEPRNDVVSLFIH